MADPFVVAVVGFSMDDAGAAYRKIAAEEFPNNPMPPVGISRTTVHVYASDLVEEEPTDPYQPRAASFVSCGLPDGHPQWESYAVHAVNAGGGWWQVRRLGKIVVSAGGEETRSNREDCPEDTPDLFMDVDTALRVAARHAEILRLRAGTAAEVLAADRKLNRQHNPGALTEAPDPNGQGEELAEVP